MRSLSIGAAVLLAVLGSAARVVATCAGDCDGNGVVTITELTRTVNIALGTGPLSSCAAADLNGDGRVQVNEVISAVNASLNNCSDPCLPANGAQCGPPGTTSMTACGFHGTQNITCGSNCRWFNDGDCINPGECHPGNTDTQDCTCGVKTRTCMSNYTWGAWGSCVGQGECTVGDMQTVACGGRSENVKKRTCEDHGSGGCSWGTYSLCSCPGIQPMFHQCSPCGSGFHQAHADGTPNSTCSSNTFTCAPNCGNYFDMCVVATNQCPTGYTQSGSAVPDGQCSIGVGSTGSRIHCVLP